MTFTIGQIVHSKHYPEERMRIRSIGQSLLICEMIDQSKFYTNKGELGYPTSILLFENVLTETL